MTPARVGEILARISEIQGLLDRLTPEAATPTPPPTPGGSFQAALAAQLRPADPLAAGQTPVAYPRATFGGLSVLPLEHPPAALPQVAATFETELPSASVAERFFKSQAAATQPSAAPAPYRRLAQQAARRHGVDEALVLAVMQTESGFNPRAVSPAGAVGLMQLMPSTAASLGVTDATDPAQNVDAGTRYLRQLLDRFNGDTALALAGYNAGPGAVEKHGGIPPYRETLAYVPKVMQRVRQFRAETAPVEAPTLSPVQPAPSRGGTTPIAPASRTSPTAVAPPAPSRNAGPTETLPPAETVVRPATVTSLPARPLPELFEEASPESVILPVEPPADRPAANRSRGIAEEAPLESATEPPAPPTRASASGLTSNEPTAPAETARAATTVDRPAAHAESVAPESAPVQPPAPRQARPAPAAPAAPPVTQQVETVEPAPEAAVTVAPARASGSMSPTPARAESVITPPARPAVALEAPLVAEAVTRPSDAVTAPVPPARPAVGPVIRPTQIPEPVAAPIASVRPAVTVETIEPTVRPSAPIQADTHDPAREIAVTETPARDQSVVTPPARPADATPPVAEPVSRPSEAVTAPIRLSVAPEAPPAVEAVTRPTQIPEPVAAPVASARPTVTTETVKPIVRPGAPIQADTHDPAREMAVTEIPTRAERVVTPPARPADAVEAVPLTQPVARPDAPSQLETPAREMAVTETPARDESVVTPPARPADAVEAPPVAEPVSRPSALIAAPAPPARPVVAPEAEPRPERAVDPAEPATAEHAVEPTPPAVARTARPTAFANLPADTDTPTVAPSVARSAPATTRVEAAVDRPTPVSSSVVERSVAAPTAPEPSLPQPIERPFRPSIFTVASEPPTTAPDTGRIRAVAVEAPVEQVADTAVATPAARPTAPAPRPVLPPLLTPSMAPEGEVTEALAVVEETVEALTSTPALAPEREPDTEATRPGVERQFAPAAPARPEPRPEPAETGATSGGLAPTATPPAAAPERRQDDDSRRDEAAAPPAVAGARARQIEAPRVFTLEAASQPVERTTSPVPPTRLDSPVHLRETVVQRATLLKTPASEEFTVQLRHPEVGQVSVRIVRQAEGVQVVLQSAHDGLRRELQAQAPQLETALRERGLELTGLDVGSSRADQQFGSLAQHQQQQPAPRQSFIFRTAAEPRAEAPVESGPAATGGLERWA